MRNRLLAFVLLGGAMLPSFAQAAFAVGDRVFVPMPSVHLREDGYATGSIESIVDGQYTVELRELVQG